jgi:hypothetical protein
MRSAGKIQAYNPNDLDFRPSFGLIYPRKTQTAEKEASGITRIGSNLTPSIDK